MDGTAKGGIAVAIQSELNVPVKYIGVGETIEDLQKFHANEFVNALFDIESEKEDMAENAMAGSATTESDTNVINEETAKAQESVQEQQVEDSAASKENDTSVISDYGEAVTAENEDHTENEKNDTDVINEETDDAVSEKPKKKKWLFW